MTAYKCCFSGAGALVYIHKLLTVQKSQRLILWTFHLKVTAMCTLETMLSSLTKGRKCQISYTCSKSWKIISAFDTDKLFYCFLEMTCSFSCPRSINNSKNYKLLIKLKNYILFYVMVNFLYLIFFIDYPCFFLVSGPKNKPQLICLYCQMTKILPHVHFFCHNFN